MRAIYLLILLLGITSIENVRAADIEQFFMPGELITGHEELKSGLPRT